MRTWTWSFAVVALAAFIACVGDDPVTTGAVKADPNAKPGELRGRCDNGRCFPPLECNKENDVCLHPGFPDGGAPTDGGGSGPGPGDDGGSGTDSGPTVACPLSEITVNDNPCPGAPGDECLASGSTLTCCLGAAGNTCVDGVNDCPDKPIRCVDVGQCGGDVCCLKLSKDAGAGPISTSTCPGIVARSHVTKVDCVAKANCVGADYEVCRNDSQCTTGTCRKVVVQSAAGDITIGACL